MPAPQETYVNSVQRRGYSDARLRPADYGSAGEIIGKAVEGFGQSLGQVAQNMTDIQKQDAETLAQDGFNQSTAARQEKIAEFKSLKGKAAIDAAPQLMQDLQKIDKDTTTSTIGHNQWARHLYDTAAAKRNGDDMALITSHVGEQRQVWQKSVIVAGAQQATEDAVADRKDPVKRDNSIATAGNFAVRMQMLDGITDPNALELARKTVQGKAISQIADSISLDEGALPAQQFVKQYEDKMNPTEYNALLTSLAPKARKEEAGNISDGIINSLTGGATDQYYPGDKQGPTVAAPPAEIDSHTETPLDIISGHHINSDFGPRSAPTAGASTNHKGLDLNYAEGTPIRATMSGIATPRDQGHDGYGKYVSIDHGNGLETRYGHMERWTVKPGQVVKKGDIIGYVGQTGTATGPHLHYEVREHGEPVDPRSIEGRQVAIGGHVLASTQSASATPAKPGDGFDLEAAISKVRDMHLHPDLEDATIAAIKERFGEHTAVREDQERQIKDSVAGYLNTLPDQEDFTDFSQLPPSTIRMLSSHPQLEQAYRDRASTNAHNKQARADAADAKAQSKASQQADLDLATIIYGDPQRFMNMDLTDPRQTKNLSVPDVQKYMGLQTTMRKSQSGVTDVADPIAMRTAVNRFAGKNPPKDIGLAYEEAVRQETRWIEQNPGKKISALDREAIARGVMTHYVVVSPGIFTDNKKTIYGYQVGQQDRPKGSYLQVDSFEAVKSELTQVWRRIPTDQEVRDEIAKRSSGGRLRL